VGEEYKDCQINAVSDRGRKAHFPSIRYLR